MQLGVHSTRKLVLFVPVQVLLTMIAKRFHSQARSNAQSSSLSTPAMYSGSERQKVNHFSWQKHVVDNSIWDTNH